MANYGNIKGTKGVDKIDANIDGGWVVPKENVDYAKTLMRLMDPDFDEHATYTKTGKKISNANSKVSDGELVLNDKQVSILERNDFDPRELSPNSPYNKYYEPKNVNFYGHTNLSKNEGNLFGMAGFDSKKLTGNLYTVQPTDKENRKYWKGLIGGNLSAKKGDAKFGPGFEYDITNKKLNPRVSASYTFNYGGKVPSLKKQNNNLNDQAY